MTLGIAQTSYTVDEGIELSVCLTYSGGELSGVNVTYEAVTMDGSATVNGLGGLINACWVPGKMWIKKI